MRTLRAFEIADEELKKVRKREPEEAKKIVAEVVSKELGNTPAITISSYIKPKLE